MGIWILLNQSEELERSSFRAFGLKDTIDGKLVKRMENLIETDFIGKGEVLVTSPFCRMFKLTVTAIFRTEDWLNRLKARKIPHLWNIYRKNLLKIVDMLLVNYEVWIISSLNLVYIIMRLLYAPHILI